MLQYQGGPSPPFDCHKESHLVELFNQQEVDKRRTFAIISHPDAGKTTITEKLLLFGGAIQQAGEVRARKSGPPCHLRLDGNGKAARHLGHLFGDEIHLQRLRDQPAGHPRPQRFFRGHLPGPDRGRLGADGDRLGQGGGEPDQEAAGSLPPAPHADHDLHQQAGPGRAGAARPAGRHREEPQDPVRAHDLADRHGQALPRHLSPLHQGADLFRSRGRPAAPAQIITVTGTGRPAPGRAAGKPGG